MEEENNVETLQRYALGYQKYKQVPHIYIFCMVETLGSFYPNSALCNVLCVYIYTYTGSEPLSKQGNELRKQA